MKTMEKGRTKKRVQDLSMQRNYHHTWWEVNPRNQVVNEEKLLAVIAAFASEKRETSTHLVRMASLQDHKCL